MSTIIGQAKLIDRWFPISAVDKACGTPAGSGLAEKAIFTWFASRPIAQARAAALTALLPEDANLKTDIESAILGHDIDANARLRDAIKANYAGKAPVVVDMFSGRGIIPLEASRYGAAASGIDLSPVAVLAGRLLADYPTRDWSTEKALPAAFQQAQEKRLSADGSKRLAEDVEIVLAEIGRRVAKSVEVFYPRNADGDAPWGYLWTISMPCDSCKRRFPLIGSLTLKYPSKKAGDLGQSLHLNTNRDNWNVEIRSGAPTSSPTYSSSLKADGKKKKGKSARCPFCRHPHSLAVVKAKGDAGLYEDNLIAVVDIDLKGKRNFRQPTSDDLIAVDALRLEASENEPYSTVPDEVISPGNVHTVMASGYGYRRFGDLMCKRQTRSFVETVRTIREVHRELLEIGLSESYARALTSFAAATLCRRIRRSTRGARLMIEGAVDGSEASVVRIGDLFVNQSKLNFQFDYLEAGPGLGPGTWSSVSETAVSSIRKLLHERRGGAVTFRQASATSLPLRDSSVDVIITDPPYYDMIEYADASDLFYVWLKRTLYDIEPDLFGVAAQQRDGLQDKNDEIIVRRVQEPNRVRHDTEFYEAMLAKSFVEARRVLKTNGQLVVMFGHSDPDAWRRLLGALQTAGFVVTSAWPSRTESANTSVASIKVTITIGCRVAEANRPFGMRLAVDRDVAEAVTLRVPQWEADGLEIEDQLMASYGPAMEIFGRYSRVLNPDGSDTELHRYLTLARKAVRDAMQLRVDELPLETFDSITRFALFWSRTKGRTEVAKGEAVFYAQTDELRIDDLRHRILLESKSGFVLKVDGSDQVSTESSTFEVVRAMAQAWHSGGTEAVASVMAGAGRQANDQQLWAVVSDLASHLAPADNVAKALAAIKRMSPTISSLVVAAKDSLVQRELFETIGRSQK